MREAPANVRTSSETAPDPAARSETLCMVLLPPGQRGPAPEELLRSLRSRRLTHELVTDPYEALVRAIEHERALASGRRRKPGILLLVEPALNPLAERLAEVAQIAAPHTARWQFRMFGSMKLSAYAPERRDGAHAASDGGDDGDRASRAGADPDETTGGDAERASATPMHLGREPKAPTPAAASASGVGARGAPTEGGGLTGRPAVAAGGKPRLRLAVEAVLPERTDRDRAAQVEGDEADADAESEDDLARRAAELTDEELALLMGETLDDSASGGTSGNPGSGPGTGGTP